MIHVLDTRWRGQEGVIAVFAVPHEGGVALVEAGPEVAFPQVAAELRALGYTLQDVTDVFLTHIHLDHAGAAWRFAEAGARVHVHPRGYRHLADPSRLVASARRIYGERMEALWGRMEAVSEDRLVAVRDGERVRVGGRTFVAHETLGHAKHHHAWQLGGALFTGDVAGVRLGGGPVLPPSPPPDIELEAWQASIEKLRALPADTLYLTHFGAYRDKGQVLEELKARLSGWGAWVRDRLKEGLSPEAMVPLFEVKVREELAAAGLDEEAAARYEAANPSAYSVYGLARYWLKHRPEAL